MNWLTRLFARPTIQQAFKDANTPKDICRIVSRNVQPCAMPKEHSNLPADTWKRGYGDCDDLAFLVAHVCQMKGINCRVWNWYYRKDTRKVGHSMAVGAGWSSSNGDYCDMYTTVQRASYIMGVAESELYFTVMEPV